MIKTENISINEVVKCHLVVFPKSIYNLFGIDVLKKTFLWYMMGKSDRNIIVYEHSPKVVGFLTMRMTGDTESFWHYIGQTLFFSFLKRPWLILNHKILCKAYEMLVANNLSITSNKMELISLGIHPDYQNKGIGKKLLEKCEDISKSLLCNQLQLYVKKNNINAIEYFYNCGWVNANISNTKYFLLIKGI